VRLTALAVMAAAMTGIAGAAPGAQHRTAMSPETFGRVESGVALVRPADCGGKRGVQGPAATGFLVGSQVLMTASRVVSAAIAQRCRMQVRLGGRWYGATSAKAWFDARSKARDVDIATLELARPAPGYLFRIARALPRRNDAVAALGHPLGCR
jgi:hypothetical protein